MYSTCVELLHIELTRSISLFNHTLSLGFPPRQLRGTARASTNLLEPATELGLTDHIAADNAIYKLEFGLQ